MPKLINKIEGLIIDTTFGSISNNNIVQGIIGSGDYMKLYKFTGIFVDLSKASNVSTYETPQNIGITNNNSQFTELNISY